MLTPFVSVAEGYAIGIDLGGTKTLGVVLSDQGDVVHRRTAATRRMLGPDDVLDDVADLVLALERDAGGADACRGVGVGVAALVDPARHVIDSIILPAWRDVDTAKLLRERVHHPVVADNDSTMALISEAWSSPWAEDTVLCVTLGTGVGAAVMYRGEIIRGLDGTAGQLGHMTVELDGRECECGSFGCLNSYVSGSALAARFSELPDTPGAANGREVWQLARQGDAAASGIIASAAYYLGAGLASLTNIFNPQLIVLAGGVVSIGQPLLGPAVATMRNRAFARPGVRARVVSAAYGSDAGAVGAAVSAGRASGFEPEPIRVPEAAWRDSR